MPSLPYTVATPVPCALTYSHTVQVYEAPRQTQRTLARLIQTNGGKLPSSATPRKVRTFQVTASTRHKARTLVTRQIRQLGWQVRSINTNHRGFVVYVTHPEDVTNAPTNS